MQANQISNNKKDTKGSTGSKKLGRPNKATNYQPCRLRDWHCAKSMSPTKGGRDRTGGAVRPIGHIYGMAAERRE